MSNNPEELRGPLHRRENRTSRMQYLLLLYGDSGLSERAMILRHTYIVLLIVKRGGI